MWLEEGASLKGRGYRYGWIRVQFGNSMHEFFNDAKGIFETRMHAILPIQLYLHLDLSPSLFP